VQSTRYRAGTRRRHTSRFRRDAWVCPARAHVVKERRIADVGSLLFEALVRLWSGAIE
jgi:hypothetical protein